MPSLRKESSRVESTKSTTRVPTPIGPVGLGTVAVISVARAELMAAATTAVPVPGKFMESGKRTIPRPDKFTVCGLSGLLSFMVRVPVKFPVPSELKVAVIKHDIPAPTLGPQSFV